MIEVYLFSGFLGSGKTSLLVNVIRQLKEAGKKPAVFMNEFGSLALDSNAVEDGIPLKEILDGCICCSGAEKTEAQMQGLLAENDDIDVILIETTGAAHPVEALDAIYSPLFADKIVVKGIVTVADSKLWLNRDTLSPRIRALYMEQIKHAHLLLANKADILTEDELATVTMEMTNFNKTAPVIQTINGDIAFSYIEEVLNSSRNNDKKTVVSGAGLPLTSKVLSFSESVKMGEFENWIKSLPDSVYRMKGFVPVVGTKNPYLFQYAYGMVNWMPENVKMDPRLVIIGEGIEHIVYDSSVKLT